MATYAGKLNVGGTELPIGSTLYGTCSTAAGTAQKDVTCANFDKLITGVTIHVKFTNSNTHATPTLKVNSTTAAQIMRYGTKKPGTSEAASWMAGSVVSFTYDGTYWQMNGWINSTYTIPSAATATPLMDGTAAVGSSAKYAKEDHVHPTDTSRVPTSRKVNNKALSADITLSASDVSAIASSAKGAANGVAELDANGLVPTNQLPSYVDDVLEYTNKASFPTTGETGKIYVDLATNLTYRWSGSAYVEISPSLALGTTSSTAFRGDYGNSAYAHAVTNKGSAFSSGLYKITTNSEGHVTAATAVAKADITGLGIPGSDTNTTYTFANGTNGFTVTPSGGSAQTVTVTPSITNNVTGSGTSGYLTKFNGTNTITNGPQLGSSTTTYLRNDGSWASPDDRYPYYGGNGTEIPANANLNTYTTPGTYYSANGTRSATLTNTPVTGSGFKLYVEAGYQGARKYQMIKYAGSPDTFTRMTDDSGSTWGPWQSTLGHKIYAVKGTQTASTNAWTGAIDVPALYDGLTIAYYLPYAGTSSSATLNLTLSTGSTTGAKNVYYANATRATTHYGAGSTIIMTYWSKGSISVSGTATTDDRWTSFDYNTNSNTYDREYLNCAVKAQTAVTTGYLTCGTSSGYKHVAKSASFDVSYPVLYAAGDVSAGSTAKTFYQTIHFDCKATNGGTSPAFTSYKAVYLYGTLSGSTFTVDSSTIFTQTVPSSENGKAYYYLGPAYSATAIRLMPEHKIFEYIGGSFREATTYSVAKCDYSASTYTLEFYNEDEDPGGFTPISTAEIDSIVTI